MYKYIQHKLGISTMLLWNIQLPLGITMKLL